MTAYELAQPMWLECNLWKRPGAWRWGRTIAWMSVLFGFVLFLFFAAIEITYWMHLPQSFAEPCAFCIPVVTVIIYASAVRFVEKRSPSEFSPHGAFGKFCLGYGIGTFLIGANLILLWSLGLYQVHLSHWTNGVDDFIFSSWVSGWLEELAFRGILLRLFAGLIGPVPALLLSSLLFGLAHLGHASWLAVFEIIINGGLGMGLLYMITGSLWASIGMHIGWDFTETSLLGINNPAGLLACAPTPGKPALLTGGSFGPDSSILATLLAMVLVGALLQRSRRVLPVSRAARV